MLLSEIVYNIKNLIAGGLESDDENLSNAQVGFMVGYYRAKLFRQDRLKGRVSREGTYVVLPERLLICRQPS